jgi:hypothetical protein
VSTPLCPICASPIPADARTCPTCGAPLAPPLGTTAAQPGHFHALKPGTRLDGGRFSIGRVLGHGGFGITYLGADLKGGHPVALKEFFPAGAGRQGLGESRAAAGVGGAAEDVLVQGGQEAGVRPAAADR